LAVYVKERFSWFSKLVQSKGGHKSPPLPDYTMPKKTTGRKNRVKRNATNNLLGFAKHRSRSHDAVIRVYDDAGSMIKTHEHKGDFKEP
jgi:hypothetical protein